MKKRLLALFAAMLGGVTLATPAVAQQPVAIGKSDNGICSIHGEGCDAAPAEWNWERHEPRIGVYSVELPCDGRQADAFARLLALTPGQFQAGASRACMKAGAGFTASMIGFVDLPNDTMPSEMEAMMAGSPDVFTAFKQRINLRVETPETAIDGRRAVQRTVERADGYSRVAIIEVSQYGVLLMLGDIRDPLGVSREEGEALLDRFFNSLEFTK